MKHPGSACSSHFSETAIGYRMYVPAYLTVSDLRLAGFAEKCPATARRYSETLDGI